MTHPRRRLSPLPLLLLSSALLASAAAAADSSAASSQVAAFHNIPLGGGGNDNGTRRLPPIGGSRRSTSASRQCWRGAVVDEDGELMSSGRRWRPQPQMSPSGGGWSSIAGGRHPPSPSRGGKEERHRLMKTRLCTSSDATEAEDAIASPAVGSDETSSSSSSSSEPSNSRTGGPAAAAAAAPPLLRFLSRSLSVLVPYLVGFRVGVGDRTAIDASASSRRIIATTPRRFPVLSLLVTYLLAKELWRSLPGWARDRASKRVSKIRKRLFSRRKRGEVTGGGGEGTELDGWEDWEEEDEYDDPDDMTSISNLSSKLRGLLASADEKLLGTGTGASSSSGTPTPTPTPPLSDARIQASSLALLQLCDQLKSQGASERDNLYSTSGVPATPEDMIGLDEGFDFADWAYDEDPSGISLKDNLANKGFVLVRQSDKMSPIPGYVGHYVAFSKERKLGLIGVKGTSTFEDLLTDCCGRAVTHVLDRPSKEMKEIRCHEGILLASKRLFDDVRPIVEELFIPAGYQILITGHSLGAGASALLGIMLRYAIPSLSAAVPPSKTYGKKGGGERLKVWAYASPPVLDYDAASDCESYITTIVNNSDVIPRASLTNLVVLLELLRAVDGKLEERGIVKKGRGDDSTVDAVALLRKLSEGKEGDMMLKPDEIMVELERIREKVELRDPDHLFVPGKVIAMYSKWEEEKKEREADAAAKARGEEDGAAFEMRKKKEPSEYVRISDGSMKVLRAIEIDDQMINDHMAPAYRKSLRELTLT